MINRPLYIRKFHSSRLKEFGYEINNTFDESKILNEITFLTDNQILRTIRDINKRTLDRKKLERLILIKDYYNKKILCQQNNHNFNKADILEKLNKKKTDMYAYELKRLQNKINRTLFQEDYITVVMDTIKQYEYLYHNGFIVNGKKYKRLSCSASQARTSTVVFCCEDIIEEVKHRLNNGRNQNKKISPSKFNAYFGLAGSSTSVVSEPKFIVVKDYVNTVSFTADYVIENGLKVDDTIVRKEIKNIPMNRTDGMGLISPLQAEKWAKELELDYIPSQFCIRQNFIKGMLCVFPIHEFAEKYGKVDKLGRCMVDTIYCDKNGNPIQKNIFDYDVIISESQFKLWDSFDNLEQYIENYRKNKLYWGISLTSPKEAKNILKLNYQFIQTLNLSQNKIEKLASQFVEWISGVSYENRYYMLLFLLGVNNDNNKIQQFLKNSDNYWIKALLLHDEIKNDKYIRTKIREIIKHKIDAGCKGDIYTNGNFQVIVSDPFGYMQHVCGLKVTGLLKKGESYSNYWNELGIKQVDAMRSPLTYLSEHVVLNLKKNDETERWYRFCKLGIILNYHGHESVNFAGSDFDFDILATTSNETMINGVYKDEVPVVYKAPKPQNILFTEDDLYKSDTFSFGSIIGSITNKSSNAYALLPIIKDKYGENSPQYKLIKSRLKQCCKAQSAQIDKAKIGHTVKGIPKVWINKNELKKNKKGKIIDKHKIQKELYNSVLLNKYPYFFRYIYKDTNKTYKKYLDEYNMICQQKFQMNFTDLENLKIKTTAQENFINEFYKYCPVIISQSPMNLLCKYIENINFNISKKIKMSNNFNPNYYKNKNIEYIHFYNDVITELKNFTKEIKSSITLTTNSKDDIYEYNEEKVNSFNVKSDILYDRLSKINSNPYIILNCLIDYFYIENPNSNKDILWKSYGKFICNNIITNLKIKSVIFPMPSNNKDFSLTYLGCNYKLQEVKIEL